MQAAPFERTAADALRLPHVAFNVIGNCLSSTCVEIGKTRLLCVVRPPQQLVQEYRGDSGRVSVQIHRAATSATAATMTGSAGSMNASRNDKDFALALEGVAERIVCLDRISQLLIEVVFEIVSEDGALWDAATIALSCALARGGIEIYDMFAACTAGVSESGALITDLTMEEEKRCVNSVVVCCSLTTGVLLFVRQHGACELSTLQDLTQIAMEGIKARKAVILQQLLASQS